MTETHAFESGLSLARNTGRNDIAPGTTCRHISNAIETAPYAIRRSESFYLVRNVDADTAQYLTDAATAMGAVIHEARADGKRATRNVTVKRTGRNSLVVTGAMATDVIESMDGLTIQGHNGSERVSGVEYIPVAFDRCTQRPSHWTFAYTGPRDADTGRSTLQRGAREFSPRLPLPDNQALNFALSDVRVRAEFALFKLRNESNSHALHVATTAPLPTPDTRAARRDALDLLHTSHDALTSSLELERAQRRFISQNHNGLSVDSRYSVGVSHKHVLGELAAERHAARNSYMSACDTLAALDSTDGETTTQSYERYEQLRSESAQLRALASDCDAVVSDMLRNGGSAASDAIKALSAQSAQHKQNADTLSATSRALLEALRQRVKRSVQTLSPTRSDDKARKAQHDLARREKVNNDSTLLTARRAQTAIRVERSRLRKLIETTAPTEQLTDVLTLAARVAARDGLTVSDYRAAIGLIRSAIKSNQVQTFSPQDPETELVIPAPVYGECTRV